jgi:hypothetical protein
VILKLAEVHDLAHRRIGLRGDLHQIKLGVFRLAQGLSDADDPKLGAVIGYESDLGRIDLAVDPDFLVLCDA